MRLGPAGERHSSSLLHQARFLIANADASSIGILSDQRESKGPSHRSALLCRRSHLLIANLELEIQITAAFSIASIFLIANILRFFITSLLATRHSSLATALLIEAPRLKLRISHAFSAVSNFLIETKRGFCIPKLARVPLSPLPRFSLSESLCLRASVANLCDNGWLKLRLM